MTDYENVRKQVIEGCKTFQKTNDVSDMVQKLIIPNFEPLACDLDEIISEIITSENNESCVLQYIELLFSSSLYNSFIEIIKMSKKEKENFVHCLIILTELTKYRRYEEIKFNLERLLTNKNEDAENKTPFEKTVLYDTLMKGSQERMDRCVDRIKYYYKDLIDNFPSYENSIRAATEMLKNNNISS